MTRRAAAMTVLSRGVIALALGVATTVVVAWSLAYGVNLVLHTGPTALAREGKERWLVPSWESPGAWCGYWQKIAQIETEGWKAEPDGQIGEDEFDSLGLPQLPLGPFCGKGPLYPDAPDVIEHRRGWPCHALACARRTVTGSLHRFATLQGAPAVGWMHGVVFRDTGPSAWDAELNALPILPIWPGFALDTILYAAAWFAVLFFRPGRAMLRRRRGLCPKCAYDLKGDFPGGCPECGWGRGAGAAAAA